MTGEEAFYPAILADPDDDTPRLILADWLEEQGQVGRAEFIRVQCQLARLPENDPRVPELRQRERQLQELHCQSWLRNLRDLATLVSFHRGFVERVHVWCPNFPFEVDKLFERAPMIREIHVSHMTDDDALRLARSPWLSRLRILFLGWECTLSERGLRALSSSPHVRGLRVVDLRGQGLLT